MTELPPFARSGREPDRRQKRMSQHLAPGEFDLPGSRLSQAAARARFLEAVHTLEPRVLAELADEPLALCKAQVFGWDVNATFALEDFFEEGENAAYWVDPAHLSLARCFQAWGAR